jgi:hypothetical protein
MILLFMFLSAEKKYEEKIKNQTIKKRKLKYLYIKKITTHNLSKNTFNSCCLYLTCPKHKRDINLKTDAKNGHGTKK